jgi:hypothetical protein
MRLPPAFDAVAWNLLFHGDASSILANVLPVDIVGNRTPSPIGILDRLWYRLDESGRLFSLDSPVAAQTNRFDFVASSSISSSSW